MNEKQSLTVVEVEGVHGYIDDEGTAWLNAADVARGLGWTQTHFKDDKEYESVRWERLNHYLHKFRFPPVTGKRDFIPENIFYRLAMKAKNEAARKFQAAIADEVFPKIRAYVYCTMKDDSRSELQREQLEIERLKRQIHELKEKNKILDEKIALIREFKELAKATENDTIREILFHCVERIVINTLRDLSDFEQSETFLQKTRQNSCADKPF